MKIKQIWEEADIKGGRIVTSGPKEAKHQAIISYSAWPQEPVIDMGSPSDISGEPSNVICKIFGCGYPTISKSIYCDDHTNSYGFRGEKVNHVGLNSNRYVLVALSDGNQYTKPISKQEMAEYLTKNDYILTSESLTDYLMANSEVQ